MPGGGRATPEPLPPPRGSHIVAPLPESGVGFQGRGEEGHRGMDEAGSGDRRLDELLKDASGGDQQAMAMVFDRYRERLARMVSWRIDVRHRAVFDVQDLLQEVYLEASRRLEDYLRDRKVPFYLWLRMIAFQKVIEANRRHNTEKRAGGGLVSLDGLVSQNRDPDADAELPFAAPQTSPSSVFLQGEAKLRIQDLLARLDEPDREVLILRHFECLSNGEFAQVLGISSAAASQRHYRALKRLRNVLGDDRSGTGVVLA